LAVEGFSIADRVVDLGRWMHVVEKGIPRGF